MDPERVREIIASVRWGMKRRTAFVHLKISHTPGSLFHCRLLLVHIDAFFVAFKPHFLPPLASLTDGISSLNPCRNVASAMERMPIVCPARLAALKRTKVHRNVNLVLTVLTSIASWKPTAPALAMQRVVNAYLGESSWTGSLPWFLLHFVSKQERHPFISHKGILQDFNPAPDVLLTHRQRCLF